MKNRSKQRQFYVIVVSRRFMNFNDYSGSEWDQYVDDVLMKTKGIIVETKTSVKAQGLQRDSVVKLTGDPDEATLFPAPERCPSIPKEILNWYEENPKIKENKKLEMVIVNKGETENDAYQKFIERHMTDFELYT